MEWNPNRFKHLLATLTSNNVHVGACYLGNDRVLWNQESLPDPSSTSPYLSIWQVSVVYSLKLIPQRSLWCFCWFRRCHFAEMTFRNMGQRSENTFLLSRFGFARTSRCSKKQQTGVGAKYLFIESTFIELLAPCPTLPHCPTLPQFTLNPIFSRIYILRIGVINIKPELCCVFTSLQCFLSTY